jgi:hypothetical protein
MTKECLMKSKTSWLVETSMGIVLSLFLSFGLAPLSANAADSGPDAFRVERIGVVPFFKGSYGSDITSSITCPVCDLTFDPDNLTPDCDRVLTGFAQDLLQIRYGDKLVPLDAVRKAYREMPKNEFKDTPLDLAQRLGKALSANAMIVGSVWKYRDRRGGTRAVESPASVAFAVHLVDVKTGTILWSKDFAETQRSLSENILKAPAFFARGAKWLTADELARFGMEEIFKAFPY